MSDYSDLENKHKFNWEQLFEIAPCGYILTNPDDKILKVNQVLLQWLGYEKKSELEMLPFQNILSVGSKLFYETQHFTLLKMQDSVYEINYDFITKTNSKFPALVNSTNIKSDTGDLLFIYHAVIPFSDRKKYEAVLLNAKKKSEEAGRSKMEFLSTITHEIRTPIHNVLGTSELLIQKNKDPQQAELLNVLRNSALNLLELINSILDLNKIEAGKLLLNMSPFNLATLLKELIDSFHSQATLRGIDLKLTLPEDFYPYYIGDKVKIRQVLSNIIGNSIKFTKVGFVELKLKSKPDLLSKRYLEFEIIDTGIGMHEEELSKIFDIFTQANDSIAQEFGGSGLGLTIAQKILRAFGSQLKVKSKVGKGTVFNFILRLKLAEAVEEKKSTSGAANLESLSDIKVLVVDDNFSNLFIVAQYFKNWNIPFERASSGQEALDLLRENKFDLILMDLLMPGMNGYETTEKIRSMAGPHYQKVPIIAFSAATEREINEQMKAAGFDDLFLKPYNSEQLHSMIRHYGREGRISMKRENEESADSKDVDSGELKLFNPKLEKVYEIFDDDSEATLNYLEIVAKEIAASIEEINNNGTDFSAEEFWAAGHKLKTTITFFELPHLKKLFEKGKTLIERQNKVELKNVLSEITTFLTDLRNWILVKTESGNLE